MLDYYHYEQGLELPKIILNCRSFVKYDDDNQCEE